MSSLDAIGPVLPRADNLADLRRLAGEGERAALVEALARLGIRKMGLRQAAINLLSEPAANLLAVGPSSPSAGAPAAGSLFEPHLARIRARPFAAVDGVRYIVVHRPVVMLRANPAVSAKSVGHRMPGDIIVCRRDVCENGWLKLVNADGWILEDATPLGLGPLVERVADDASPAAVEALQAAYPMVVLASDGMCCRLRIVLSFALVARARGRPLIVIWPLSRECAHGRFTDAFEPIDGVQFVEEVPVGVKHEFSDMGSDFRPEVKGTPAEDACYALLTLNAAARAAVEATVASCCVSTGSYISLHVRRTDHWGSGVTDAEFAVWADRHPYSHVYLATDSRETQSFFRSRLGAARVHVATQISEEASQALRQTSMLGAVVDLYCAAAATGPFMGTPTSSYSDTILRLRRVQGRTHPLDAHECTDAVDQGRVTLLTPGGHLSHSTTGMARSTYPSLDTPGPDGIGSPMREMLV